MSDIANINVIGGEDMAKLNSGNEAAAKGDPTVAWFCLDDQDLEIAIKLFSKHVEIARELELRITKEVLGTLIFAQAEQRRRRLDARHGKQRRAEQVIAK